MISIEGLLEDEQGLSMGEMLTVKICQPSHEFTFGVGISFIPYPLVLTPWYNKFTCACRIWSLLFMQVLALKARLSDKFIKHLVGRLWNPVQVMEWSKLNSKKSGTWSEKMTNSEDLTRKVSKLARQEAMSNSERNWRQRPTCGRGKDPGSSGTDIKQRRPRAGPGWAQAGWPRPTDPAQSRARLPPPLT
jgi:hypothetical protein